MTAAEAAPAAATDQNPHSNIKKRQRKQQQPKKHTRKKTCLKSVSHYPTTASAAAPAPAADAVVG